MEHEHERDQEDLPRGAGAPPRRPLLVAAGVAVAGTSLGLAAPFRDDPLAAVLLASSVALVRPARVAAACWWPLAVLFAVALLTAQRVAPSGAIVPTAEPALGRFRAQGRSTGRLDVAGPHALGALLELEDAPPESGEWVALAPGLERVPWPSATVPGSAARTFPAGSMAVAADGLVRLGGARSARTGAALAEPDGFGARFAAWRAERATRLEEAIGPELGGLARALVFGDRRGLDPELADRFTRTGTRHLLAVSGLHVGLVAGLLLLPLVRRAARAGRTGSAFSLVGTAGFLLAFALLAGGGAPVQRAALALAVGAAASCVRFGTRRALPLPRAADGLSLWSLALLFELVADPLALRSLSVQLSYLATLGMIVGARPATRLLGRGLPRGTPPGVDALRRVDAPRRTALVALGRRTARALVAGVATSAVAVLATLPVTWPAFGELAPVGVLLTPLLLPLFATLLLALFAAVLLPVDAMARSAASLGEHALGLLVRVLEVADGVTGTPLPLPARPLALIAFVVVLAFVALRTRRPRATRLATVAAGALLLPWSTAPRELEVVLLDVGHGTALVLRAPGEPALVFDAGSKDRRFLYREALAPLLARWEVARPAVVLSHDDRDHASGLDDLVERYPPRAFWGELPPALARRLPPDCERLDVERGAAPARAAQGRPELVLLRGAELAGNEGSRTVVVEAAGARLLLMGDAEGEGLAALLRQGLVRGPFDLLLFPHHGSETPWIDELLATARPRRVWVSAGAEPALAAEFDRRRLDWESTSRAGPLTLVLGSRAVPPVRNP